MSEIPPPPKGFERVVAAPPADIPPPPAGFTRGGAEIGDNGRPVVRITKTYPDQGVAHAIGQGAAQGLTAGFSDEIRGLSEAGGTEPDEPAGLGHVLLGFAKYLAQDPEAHQKFNEAVDRGREALKGARENHPYATGAGEVGGALLTLPLLGGASEAATVGGRALAAAKQGAAYGGLSGAGEGEGLADKAIKAAGGTVLGGVIGGVAAPVIEGVAAGARAATAGLRNTMRAAKDPETEAARQYLTMLEKDREADPRALSRMTPAEFRANPESMMVDYGGDAVKRLADVASITSPKAQTILKHEINQRFEGQTGRFSDWFRSNFNYPDAYSQQQAIDQVAKSVNGPAYRKLFSANPVVSVPDEITSRPVVQQAMKDAVSLAKNYGEKLHGNPEIKTILAGDGYHIAEDVATPAETSLQYWDYVKKALDARINGMTRKGGIDELDSKQKADLGGLINAKNALVSHLDNVASGYKQVRQGAAGFFGAENALEAGQKFARSDKIGLSEARAQLAKMSPAERRLFTDGFVSDFVDNVINRVGDRRDVLQKIGRSPAARSKLELVMGPEKFRELEAKIRVEGIFDDVRKAVQGNSWTARRLYDAGMLGGGSLGADGTYNMDPKEMALGAFTAALASKGKSVNVNVATKLAEMLVSKDPAVVQKGFKAISGNSGMMDALRAADAKIGRITSLAAPTKPVLQATGAVSADDQPDVPGPVKK